jgi:hypothetical protein
MIRCRSCAGYHECEHTPLRYSTHRFPVQEDQNAIRSLRPTMARAKSQSTASHTTSQRYHKKLHPNAIWPSRTSLSPPSIFIYQATLVLCPWRLRLRCHVGFLYALLLIPWIPLLCCELPGTRRKLVPWVLEHVLHKS